MIFVVRVRRFRKHNIENISPTVLSFFYFYYHYEDRLWTWSNIYSIGTWSWWAASPNYSGFGNGNDKHHGKLFDFGSMIQRIWEAREEQK
jgi:hypothetical protein